MPAPFDILTRRYQPTDGVIDLWVHSSLGSDNAAGTQDSPIASTPEALGRIPTFLWGRRAVVRYLPGHQETINRLIMPPLTGAGPADDLGLDGIDPAWDYLRSQLRLQAAPGTVDNVTGVITLHDATVGFLTVTDASKSWTPNEHYGRALINPGAPAEHGMIYGNTATQLFVASVGFSGSNLRIVGRDARLTLGDASILGVPSGLLFTAGGISTALVGLELVAAPGSGPVLDIAGPASVAVLLCDVNGGLQVRNTAGTYTVDACYLRNGSYAPNSGTLAVRQCLVADMATNYHAVTGQYDLLACRVERCGAMGHGGTATPQGGFRVDNCWIDDANTDGVFYGGGARARITNTRIDNAGADAIRAEGNGLLSLVNVIGTGSAGYGARIDLGANVVPSGTTVAGASGQVRLGSNTFTWAAAPQTDNARLARFGA